MLREKIQDLRASLYVGWYDFKLRALWRLYRFKSIVSDKASQVKNLFIRKPSERQRENEFYWCPVCNGGDPMNERYGSRSKYHEIMKEWGSAADYFEHLRTKEYAEDEEEEEDDFLYDFSYVFPGSLKGDYDTVLFLLCPNCGIIFAEEEYQDYKNAYSDW